jgi:tight adherence protein C
MRWTIMLVCSVGTGAVLWPCSRPREVPFGARADSRWPRSGWLARAGRLVKSWRPLGDWLGDDVGDGAVGAVVISSMALVVIVAPLAPAAPCGLAFVVVRRRRSRLRAEMMLVVRGLPDVIDLIALGVGAGLTLRHALAHAVAWMPAPFGSVFTEALQRSTDGESLIRSLDWCEPRLGDPSRPLLRVLIAAERDGAALLPALERAADEARRQRRVQAEERARKVPVTMLFPLVLCVLPAFALLTVIPLLLGTLADLELPG